MFVWFIIVFIFVPPILTTCFASSMPIEEERLNYINSIIDNHIQELKDKGYTEVRYMASPLVQENLWNKHRKIGFKGVCFFRKIFCCFK